MTTLCQSLLLFRIFVPMYIFISTTNCNSKLWAPITVQFLVKMFYEARKVIFAVAYLYRYALCSHGSLGRLKSKKIQIREARLLASQIIEKKILSLAASREKYLIVRLIVELHILCLLFMYITFTGLCTDWSKMSNYSATNMSRSSIYSFSKFSAFGHQTFQHCIF